MKVTHVFDDRRYRTTCGHISTAPEHLTGLQLPRVGQSWPCSRCTKREADVEFHPNLVRKIRGKAKGAPRAAS